MDDIYDNLECYDDDINYEQLRTENIGLKNKLEEYQTALSKLQKAILQDFDDLTSQHQRLLENYSSLLKTAKAEVERKTAMIASINKEKDALFLSLLQDKTNKHKYNKAKKALNMIHQDRRLPDGPDEKHGLRKDNSCRQKDHSLERRESEPKKIEHDFRKVIHENMRRHDKENQKSSFDPQPWSVANLRKSVTMARQDLLKFSSEDEDESNSTLTAKSLQLREEEHLISSKYPDDRLIPTSEHFNIDNRVDYRESQRDEPRWRAREPIEGDRIDKLSDRNKNNESRSRNPNRENRRYQHRSRERYRDSDDARRRFDRSPPRDRYARTRSRDRRYFERDKFDYEQQRQKQCHDRQVHKRFRYEPDEPDNKRRRMDIDIDGDLRRHERDLMQHRSETFIPHTSCQSPDEIHVEYAETSEPIKEIMYTAETPQDDPRKVSSRYIPMGEGDNKVWLSGSASQIRIHKLGPWTNKTVVKPQKNGSYKLEDNLDLQGKNADFKQENRVLKPIEIQVPKPPEVQVPKTPEIQVPKPLESRDLMSEVYMDIDNLSRDSLESGELDDFDIYDNIDDSPIEHTSTSSVPLRSDVDNTVLKSNTRVPNIFNPAVSNEFLKKFKIRKMSKTETLTPLAKLPTPACNMSEKNRPEVPTKSRANKQSSEIPLLSKCEKSLEDKSSVDISTTKDTLSKQITSEDSKIKKHKPSKTENKNLEINNEDRFTSKKNKPANTSEISKKSCHRRQFPEIPKITKSAETDSIVENKYSLDVPKPSEPPILNEDIKSSKHRSDVILATSKKSSTEVEADNTETSTKPHHEKQCLEIEKSKYADEENKTCVDSPKPLDTILKPTACEFSNASPTASNLNVGNEDEQTNNKNTKTVSADTSKPEKSVESRQRKQSSVISKVTKHAESASINKDESFADLPKPLDTLLKQMTRAQSSSTQKPSLTISLRNLNNENEDQVGSQSGKKSITIMNSEVKSIDKSHFLNTPGKRGLVAGDLELSDESTDDDDNDHAMTKNSKHTFIKNLDQIKDKKEKVKSEKESQNIELNKKEIKASNDDVKTKDINAKISYLFGETSLVTPEDLDIKSHSIMDPCSIYIPSNDDTLDMWKVCENKELDKTGKNIVCTTGEGKTENEDKKEKKTSKKRAKGPEKISEKRNTVHMTNKSTKSNDKDVFVDKDVSKSVDIICNLKVAKIVDNTKLEAKPENIDKITSVNEAANSRENLRVIPASFNNEPDVYKTVVISSGTQPQCVVKVASNDNNKNTCFKLTDKADNVLQDFATSTPLRGPQKDNPPPSNDISVKAPEKNISSSTQGLIESDGTPNESLQSNTAEVPHVRVIVKRRKRRHVKEQLN